MSFLNIGFDGPPNHNLEIEGNMFVSSNVKDGTYIPFETETKLRFRTKPPGAASNEYRVTDLSLSENRFGISAPSPTVPTDFTSFCITEDSKVGIGTVPTKILDVNGSLYETGSLTCDSNLITGTLSVNDTITCSKLEYGPTSDIYGLLPSNVILMTTLTGTPSGWTDITSNFTNKLVMLRDNGTLTTSGNDSYTINTTHNHTHNITQHTVSHNHTATAALTSAGNHSHTISATSIAAAGTNHTHTYEDTYVLNKSFGVTSDWPNINSTASILYQNADVADTFDGGSHSHNASGTYESANANHNHAVDVDYSGASDNGGAHTHGLNNAGQTTQTSLALVPPYYTVRFIKKI